MLREEKDMPLCGNWEEEGLVDMEAWRRDLVCALCLEFITELKDEDIEEIVDKSRAFNLKWTVMLNNKSTFCNVSKQLSGEPSLSTQTDLQNKQQLPAPTGGIIFLER